MGGLILLGLLIAVVKSLSILSILSLFTPNIFLVRSSIPRKICPPSLLLKEHTDSYKSLFKSSLDFLNSTSIFSPVEIRFFISSIVIKPSPILDNLYSNTSLPVPLQFFPPHLFYIF